MGDAESVQPACPRLELGAVEAALFLGNAQYVATRSTVALARARATVERRLTSSGPRTG